MEHMIYVISDTHFGHENIIKYASRPFSSVEEMDNTIIQNWNKTVSDSDTVIHLGDVRHGKGSLTIEEYFSQLNGTKILLKGNHEHGQDGRMLPFSYYIKRGKHRFLLIHDPNTTKVVFKNQWIIHGHSHNYGKFIDKEKRRINVSVENIEYTPISIEQILSLLNK